MTNLTKITLDYWTAVKRVRRPPVTPTAREMILDDLEVLYLQERAGASKAAPAGNRQQR